MRSQLHASFSNPKRVVLTFHAFSNKIWL